MCSSFRMAGPSPAMRDTIPWGHINHMRFPDFGSMFGNYMYMHMTTPVMCKLHV